MLTIKSVMSEDSGLYTCIASNEVSEDRSSANLTVEGTRGLEGTFSERNHGAVQFQSHAAHNTLQAIRKPIRMQPLVAQNLRNSLLSDVYSFLLGNLLQYISKIASSS